MDPRINGSNNNNNNTNTIPFARPPSQPNDRDPYRAPIPASPYTLQAPVQRQPSITNDPFLPRRQEQGNTRSDVETGFRHGPPSIASYAMGLPRDALGNATENYNRVQDNGGGWRFGDGRTDHFRSQASGGSSNSTPLPPPPPPPPQQSLSSFAGSLHDSISQRDLGPQPEYRISSPRMYGATQEVPPPPLQPQFGNRPMLPPSPSYNARASISQILPPPPPFPSARELLAPSSTNRPGSSMSILSMLDSGPTRSSREPSTAAPLNGTSPTSSYPPSSQHLPPAPSPTRSNHSNGFPQRSSPEKHHVSHSHSNRPFRAYSGGTANRSHTTVKPSSPDFINNGPLSANALPQKSPRSDTALQPGWKQEHNRDTNLGQVIDRPNSQPTSYKLQLEGLERANQERLHRARQEQLVLQKDTAARDENPRRENRNGVSSFDFLPREAQLERQRQLERQAQHDRQQRLEQEQQVVTQGSPQEDRLRGMDYPFLTQSSVFSEPSMGGSSADKSTFASRFNRDTQTSSNISKGLNSDDTLRRLREEHQNPSQRMSSDSAPAPRSRLLESVDERQMQSYPQSSMSGPMERTRSVDGLIQHKGLNDGSQGHRDMLGLLNDNRRPGRISPLPQAVQGAQGQTRGPSSDPSIKNEFSRMFAGIGSGVGSAGMNSGASTPFKPPSPAPTTENDNRTPFGNRVEITALHKSQNGSRAGKRRKIKDVDSKDLEIIEDRSAGINTSKPNKRRHGHQHHDHHRLHHHRLNENGTPSRMNSNPFNPADHRHHHHPHHEIDSAGNVIHHHSHSKTKPVPAIPSITINNEAIVSSINTLPRRHLGSVLYSPTLEAPDLEHSHTISHYVIPRCDGKANCTMTVCIPRFYLSKEEREQLCRTRYVYGTDVYADDSDPLGVAIHAGWICGDWGDDSVLEALGMGPSKEEGKRREAQLTLLAPPARPMQPVPGKDLHITLLILPPLQKYVEKRSHGMKSREWGSDHDGMSYRITKIQWVDEGASRSEERTAAARRKRVRAALGPKDAGPALHLGSRKTLASPLESVKVGIVAA